MNHTSSQEQKIQIEQLFTDLPDVFPSQFGRHAMVIGVPNQLIATLFVGRISRKGWACAAYPNQFTNAHYSVVVYFKNTF